MTRKFLNKDHILDMHKRLIDAHGGSHGLRDNAGLESAIGRYQNGYYKNIFEETAALMQSLVVNHPFVDGNKRIAFAAGDVFLRINGYKLATDSETIYDFLMQLFEMKNFSDTMLKVFLSRNTLKD